MGEESEAPSLHQIGVGKIEERGNRSGYVCGERGFVSTSERWSHTNGRGIVRLEVNTMDTGKLGVVFGTNEEYLLAFTFESNHMNINYTAKLFDGEVNVNHW